MRILRIEPHCHRPGVNERHFHLLAEGARLNGRQAGLRPAQAHDLIEERPGEVAPGSALERRLCLSRRRVKRELRDEQNREAERRDARGPHAAVRALEQPQREQPARDELGVGGRVARADAHEREQAAADRADDAAADAHLGRGNALHEHAHGARDQ